MPTQEADAQSVGTAVKQVAERTSAIVRLELELAAMELKRKVVALGLGIGLGLGAVVFLLLMVVFGLATVAAALATTMSVWLALLIMMGACLLIAGVLGTFAIMSTRKGTPPVPKQAIQEAKLTSEALKSNGAGR